MTRIIGLERDQAPWHLRWFYGVMRKMFGKDLTPVKFHMRAPGLVWGSIAMEKGLTETASIVAPYSTRKSAHGCAHRLSVLNRYQFCRGQKSRIKR
jgi:hypothetical protein